MGKPSQPRRGRRRRRPRPYRQGDLDALCGVYSIVNAVQALCPELRRPAATGLFHDLMCAMRKAGTSAAAAAVTGIEHGELVRLSHHAIRYIARRHGLALTSRPMPCPRPGRDLAGLWRDLHARLSPVCVAVIALGGRRDHWTVAVGVTPQRLLLFDSDGMRWLSRSHCGVGHAGGGNKTLISRRIVLMTRATTSTRVRQT